MIKSIKNIILVSSALFSLNAVANSDDIDDTDYNESYYEDEGRLMFKVKAYGMLQKGKQTKLPTPTNSSVSNVGHLFKQGAGISSSTTIFFNDNVAAEISLGFNGTKLKGSSINAVASNYGSSNSVKKHKYFYGIPIALTGQYHVAPFGAVRPYIGAGYGYQYIISTAKMLTVSKCYGAIAQVGVDFIAKDDTLFNVDVSQYFMKPRIKYKASFVGTNGVSSRIKMNPLLISIGVGFNI